MEVGGSSSAPEASLEAEAVRPPPTSGPWDYALLCGVGGSVTRVPSLLPDNEEDLPPLLISTGEEEEAAGSVPRFFSRFCFCSSIVYSCLPFFFFSDVLVEESPAPCQILHLLEEGGPRPLTFVLNANLLVNVKLVTCE